MVRLLPDHADTVLWFTGPVAYSHSGLNHGLLAELRRWERSYNDGLTTDLHWRSTALARHFTSGGHRLGQQVADELGAGFTVEVHSFDGVAAPRRFRGLGAAWSPAAAAAFGGIAEAERSEWENVRRMRDEAAERGE
ncbi:MAG: hypothetical protein JWQ43_285 [Glaciihabitans sp.]|nr:hypothetical protein [Glaciihabitans sp.]